MRILRGLVVSTLFLTGWLVVDVRGAAAQQPSATAPEAVAAGGDKTPPVGPEPGFIERQLLAMEKAEEEGPHGFSVTFGDIKPGSGPSLGPAYGRTFDGGLVLAAKAVYSLRNAKLVQVSLQSPPLSRRRMQFRSRARWQDVPDVTFHGLSPSRRDEEGSYSETISEFSGVAAFRPAPLLRFEVGTGAELFSTSAGDAEKGPLELFAGVPGVGADPRYLHSRASAALDSRESEGYTRSGSLVRATLHDFRQWSAGPYSFRRVDLAAEQYVAFLNRTRVVYLGLHASTTTPVRGATVPFFLMPEVGGQVLRGYDLYRFRNRHSINVTAEYRWAIRDYLDGAVFYDAGKAVAERRDLDLSGLRGSLGAGISLHGPRSTALRLEVARSGEGTHVIVSFQPVGG